MHHEEKANEGGQNIDKQIFMLEKAKRKDMDRIKKNKRNQKARITGEKTPKKTREDRKK